MPSRILGSRLKLRGLRRSTLPRGDCDATFSVFQLPKPFGLALKSPNLGAFDDCVCGGGERIDSGIDAVEGRLNFGLTGE